LNEENSPHGSPIIRLYIASLAGGGSERVCTDLANGFVDQGLAVELLLVNAFGPYLARLDSRVRVADFKASRGLKALRRVSRHLHTSPTIPVLVFGFNLGVTLLLAKRLGLHKSPVVYREGSSPQSNIKRSQQWAYRWAIGRADKVIAQSKSIYEELVQLGLPGEIIMVIPNPARPAATLPQPPAREPKEAPLVLGIGRLAPEKGFDRLIRAFAVFRSQATNARLAILGEGTERARLERLIGSHGLTHCVTLPGFVTDLRPWYERASLFALSSRYEGQPNSLIDAILHECPVVCAAGRGGTIQLMREAGLEECLVSDDPFELLFADQARRVLAMDDSRWHNARERLMKLTDAGTVQQRYLEACGITANQPNPLMVQV
jgi:glycosyltransferase involved in cell wall biosynthesis